jgi:hypothetical protein
LASPPLLVCYTVETWPFALRARGMAVVFMSYYTAAVFNIFVNPIALPALHGTIISFSSLSSS